MGVLQEVGWYPYGVCTKPMVNDKYPYGVRQDAMLITGLVQNLLGYQLSSTWTPVHKPSSNSGLPIAWITAPATDASLL